MIINSMKYECLNWKKYREKNAMHFYKILQVSKNYIYLITLKLIQINASFKLKPESCAHYYFLHFKLNN